LAAEKRSEFSHAFREAVEEAGRRTGRLKKELARECGLRPDRFSHLQSGLRRPTQDEVLRIGKGLQLDEATTNRLLSLAGYPSLSRQTRLVAESTLTAELGAPEQALAEIELEDDLGHVRRAWAHYAQVQGRNQAREWEDAAAVYDQGMEHYWRLRAIAARYLAQVNQADATAREHLNLLPQAQSRCERGLAAAVSSGSQPFQVMLNVRLGSIKRLRSRYGEAGEHYERALEVLARWGAAGGPGAERRTNEAWREHWTARIQRMQGWLELFKGRPAEALRRLEPSLEHFKRVQHDYELAQVCYGLGWAYSLRGDVEEAISWNRQGLDYAQQHNRTTGRTDDRSLLQGHLYLGGDHLDTGDLIGARTHLEAAASLAAEPRLHEYHEVGRVQLLLGKLEMRESAWPKAGRHLHAALAFFSRLEEKVLLATAYNTMGDFYLESGGGRQDLQGAECYQRALEAARSSQPSNSYYECAALVNLCRVRMRGNLAPDELTNRPDGTPSAESGWEIDALIGRAREIGREHRYRNHLARLAVIEADLALQRGDGAGASHSASRALHVAHNFSQLVLTEVRDELRRLGLPEELLDTGPGLDDG
jgi:tetratricopeptide (TPR) repeat protein